MKKRIIIIILLFSVFFLIGCDTFIISPLVPLISHSLNIKVGSGGYLVTLYSIFYVIFSPLLGPISDRIGRKKMIATGMFIFAISSFATGMATRFSIMLIARALTGVGAAFAAPNVWSYIGDFFEYKERGRITAIIASALSLGMILGVPIGSFLAELINWEESFYVLGVISAVATLGILIGFPEIMVKNSTNENYGNQFKKVFKQSSVIYSFFVTLCIAFANFGLYTFLGYWINKCFNLNVSYVGLFLIVAGIGNLIGMQIGGILSDKYSKKQVVVCSTLFMGITLILLPLCASNIYLTAVDVFLWLATGGASFAVMQVIITQLSQESRGTVMAVNNSFMWSGTALGSALVSVVINNFSFSESAIICAVVACIGSLMLKFLVNENSNIEESEL